MNAPCSLACVKQSLATVRLAGTFGLSPAARGIAPSSFDFFLQLYSALSSVVRGGDDASARKCGTAPKRNPVIGRQKDTVWLQAAGFHRGEIARDGRESNKV